jgi:peptide/nickel transport system substrate-binding protein
MSANLAPDQIDSLLQTWGGNGRAIPSEINLSSVGTVPQLMDPAFPPVLNVDFRRALIHALDRQTMVETIMAGRSTVAHSPAGPGLVEYEHIQGSVLRYEYDPRRSAQLLEQIGYRKGSSGFYEDASGQPLTFEHWVPQEEQERVRGMFATTDYWRRVGLNANPVVIPAAQARDRAYMAQFPAFRTGGYKGDYVGLQRFFHGSETPTAENAFVGNNRSRYVNAELDAALDRFLATIPLMERSRHLAQWSRMLSEQVTFIGYYYIVWETMANNRVKNVFPSNSDAKTFNAHLWDVS